ncbi:MAG: type II toxin-antitoxin system VapC family toxin [Cryomorphaceae bacterium]|nr:type II toxin-antitoxin system VapC family toxin [Flavobacteriales bacterium]
MSSKFVDQIVFIDTAPLIYFIEGHSKFQEKLIEIFKSNDQGEFRFQTSSLTLIELLVQPYKQQNSNLAARYEQILTDSENIDIFEVDLEIARTAAKLRADYNFKTPDAIQLATGLEKSANLFLTNDKELKRIKDIEVITLDEI